MRAALLYFLVHAWTADRYRQAQREAPARAASRARRTPRRRHRVRGLPTVVTPHAYRAGAAHDRTGHPATTPRALAVTGRLGLPPATEGSGARAVPADARNPR